MENLNYAVQGEGKPVVLLHGSMATKEQWIPLTGELLPDYKVITLDLIGYGKTPRPENLDDYSLKDESLLVQSVLDKVLEPNETYHLVGHSYGGVVGMQHAYYHQDRIDSLAVYEPMCYHLLDKSHEYLTLSQLMIGEMQKDIDAGNILKAAETFIELWMPPGTFKRISDREKAALAEGVIKMVVDFRAASTEPLYTDDYKKLTLPVCLITGKTSPPYSLSISEVIGEILPDCVKHQVDGGHFAPVSHSHQVNPIITDFFRNIDQGNSVNKAG